ncbi:unnamed protein product [Urochloa humidicola]
MEEKGGPAADMRRMERQRRLELPSPTAAICAGNQRSRAEASCPGRALSTQRRRHPLRRSSTPTFFSSSDLLSPPPSGSTRVPNRGEAGPLGSGQVASTLQRPRRPSSSLLPHWSFVRLMWSCACAPHRSSFSSRTSSSPTPSAARALPPPVLCFLPLSFSGRAGAVVGAGARALRHVCRRGRPLRLYIWRSSGRPSGPTRFTDRHCSACLL